MGQRLSCIYVDGRREGERRTVTVLEYIQLPDGPAISVREEEGAENAGWQEVSSYYLHRMKGVQLLDSAGPSVDGPRAPAARMEEPAAQQEELAAEPADVAT